LSGQKQEIALLYAADEIGNGRSATGKRFARKRAFPARRADGSGEEASYCPAQWRIPMATSLLFDISLPKKPAIGMSKSWTENRILIYQNLS
jgi:hypothetical protein